MQHALKPRMDRGPLRVLFTITSMPVGGAETLLVNLVRRLDRDRFAPEICCLKQPGPLGEMLTNELPVHSRLLSNKYDVTILPRLTRLIRQRKIDAAITVGAGDKMFWGRLAAWRAGVPVVLSALHSTGWPDGIGRMNRCLTPLNDAFIAVAERHRQHLVEVERLPADRVRVVHNGVDTERFHPDPVRRQAIRKLLNIDEQAPVCGIVAALRPEKNHELFLRAAVRIQQQLPQTQFLIVGDGPLRGELERYSVREGLARCVKFLGSRNDTPELLAAMDLFMLTSHNEANPVSILEAMSTELPVVATRVGSVSETVAHGVSGYLATPGDEDQIASYAAGLLTNRAAARHMGMAGRGRVIAQWSLEQMVTGYENLIAQIYDSKAAPKAVATESTHVLPQLPSAASAAMGAEYRESAEQTEKVS